MATQMKPAANHLYEEDFFVWSQKQASLLRARRFDELDLENLIEEVENLGGALRRSVCLHAMIVIGRLLKLQDWEQSPQRLVWRDAVRRERSELLNELTPSLRRHLADSLSDLYERARHDAEGTRRDHGEQDAAEALPKACPYALDQIAGDRLP